MDAAVEGEGHRITDTPQEARGESKYGCPQSTLEWYQNMGMGRAPKWYQNMKMGLVPNWYWNMGMDVISKQYQYMGMGLVLKWYRNMEWK